MPWPGVGPSGFAWLPRPLPHRIRNWPPAYRTPVGYQSVGMRPSSGGFAESGRGARFSETSKTAIALLSASAANSVDSSLESARAFGVLPSDGPSGAASLKYRNTFFLAVSTIATWSVAARATNSRDPDAFETSAEGRGPTRTLPAGLSVPSG